MPPPRGAHGDGMALKGLAAAALLTVACSQPSRLRVVNGCGDEPIWVAAEADGRIAPDSASIRIEPLQHHDFITPDGTSSARYWPKLRCNEQGTNCAVGSNGGHDEACVGPDGDRGRCAPAVDSRLEASFGNAALPCNPKTAQTAGCDLVDVRPASGFTLPYRLETKGNCFREEDEVIESNVIDCSRLSLEGCPASEHLAGLGGLQVDLRAVDPHTKQVSGCYSPCQRLTDPGWGNTLAKVRQPTDAGVATYCQAGGLQDTAFAAAVRQMCPALRWPSGSAGAGRLRCHAATQYEVTFFCPRPAPAPAQAQGPSVSAGTAALTLASAASLGDMLQLVSDAGCHTMCTYRGKEANCGFRVQYAMEHRFKGKPDSCRQSVATVHQMCPACGGCTAAEICDAEAGDAEGKEYDCMNGLFNWRKAWTDGKKAWCCKHEDRGCEGGDGAPYDCKDAGGAQDWSTKRRTWCCLHENTACHSGGAAVRGAVTSQAHRVVVLAPPTAAPRPGVPRTRGEALKQVLLGLFTGPVAALGLSFLGSFAGLALGRKCRDFMRQSSDAGPYHPSPTPWGRPGRTVISPPVRGPSYEAEQDAAHDRAMRLARELQVPPTTRDRFPYSEQGVGMPPGMN